MWKIKIIHDRILIGERFSISFQRTLRIPDDGQIYPLPPSLGTFPVRRVEDFPANVPANWSQHRGVFIPMYQREAMWLAFDAARWKPNAVKIGVGKINALTGNIWDQRLHDDQQDYIICPEQPWLDGINVGDGIIRQFVAMPLGEGYTVEGQLSGSEQHGGLQVLVYEPKPGIFPDEPPPEKNNILGRLDQSLAFSAPLAPDAQMGLAAGGKIEQKIYLDSYGLSAWDQSNFCELYIHIVNSIEYQNITGEPAPPSPVDAKIYTKYGFPWFNLYEEMAGDLAATDILSELKSIQQVDHEKGRETVDPTIDIPQDQIKKIDAKESRHQKPK